MRACLCLQICFCTHFRKAARHTRYLALPWGSLVPEQECSTVKLRKLWRVPAPPQRAGMASGISATTRFVGLLFGVAGLGAVLSHGVNARFVSADAVRALDPNLLAQAAKRVASGDLDGVIGILGESARDRFTLRHRALLRGLLAMRA